jgi:hypothetical protein
VSSVIHNGLSHRRDVILARCGKEGKGAYQKKGQSGTNCVKGQGEGKGRKRKMLSPPPAQEVDVPLVVGGVSCSPLTGINANDSSVGPSIGMSSYEDATIGDNTVAQHTNDDLI